MRELEQSRATAEEELLSTARAVTDAEKKLKKLEGACRKHEVCRTNAPVFLVFWTQLCTTYAVTGRIELLPILHQCLV